MKYTPEEKYKWLCSQLNVVHIDYWECDAILELKRSIYVGFSESQLGNTFDIDELIEWAMDDKFSQR